MGKHSMPLPKTESEWQERARAYLKQQLKDADVTYPELAKRIRKFGFNETTASITMKLKRGTFSATFFLAALAAISCKTIRLEDI